MTTIPAGWLPHTDPTFAAQGWYYNPLNPQEMAQGTPAADPLAGQMSYGALDVDEATREQKLFRSFNDSLYIDFPDFDQSGWSVLKLRLLPPWSAANRTGFVQVVRHRLYADHYPQDLRGNRQVFFETCLNIAVEGGVTGPGECPICETKRDAAKAGLTEEGTKYLNNFSPRVASIWQAIDLTTQERTAKHFVQQKDDQGRPVVDANNQPIWKVTPARFRMGNELLGDVRTIMKVNGDPTHPDFGYTIAMAKHKTGMGQMDVDYSAQMGGAKERLHDSLRPVLGNLIDLGKEEIQFTDREVLRRVADSIRSKVGLPMKWATGAAGGGAAPPPLGQLGAGGQWLVHPDNPAYEYNTQTNQVRGRA